MEDHMGTIMLDVVSEIKDYSRSWQSRTLKEWCSLEDCAR